MDNFKRINEILENANFICPVCGAPLQLTKQDERKLTFHCPSEDARFWDREDGMKPYIEAKYHWDRSARDVFIDF